MSRYLIIGCSGSGKSTLARRISQMNAIPYIETDSMYWQKGWKLATDAEVVRNLPLDTPAWVIDGNFADFREQVWDRAEHIVWLNYSRSRVLWHVTVRNLGWWLTRKRTWSGNRMSLGMSLPGIRHSVRRYAQIQETYPKLLGERATQRVLIFTSPRQVEAWLAEPEREFHP